MKLFVNENACAVNDYAGKTLEQIIASLEDNSIPENHVITTVKLNGVVLSLEEEKEIAHRYPFERIESLEILTADPKDLMVEGISAAPEILAELREKTELVVEKIRQGNIDQAMGVFQQCLELMQWFNDILTLINKLAAIDYSQISLEGHNMAELNQKLLNIYNDIIKYQQNRDWINLSDHLEYEFMPLIGLWIKLLPVFLVHLQAKLSQTH